MEASDQECGTQNQAHRYAIVMRVMESIIVIWNLFMIVLVLEKYPSFFIYLIRIYINLIRFLKNRNFCLNEETFKCRLLFWGKKYYLGLSTIYLYLSRFVIIFDIFKNYHCCASCIIQLICAFDNYGAM